MFGFISFLQKRPSDRVIRAIRFGLSIGMAGVLVFGAPHHSLPGPSIALGFWPSTSDVMIQYLVALGFTLHALCFGVLGLCVFKRGTMKKLQMLTGLGCILFALSTQSVSPSSALSNSASQTETCTLETCISKTPYTVDTPFWLVLYGIFTLLAGISGKLITSTCLKHGEIIKKIRI